MNNRVIGLGRLSLYSLAPLFPNDAMIPRVVVPPYGLSTTKRPGFHSFRRFPLGLDDFSTRAAVIIGEREKKTRVQVESAYLFSKICLISKIDDSKIVEIASSVNSCDNFERGRFLRTNFRKLKASSPAECIIFVISRGRARVNLIEGY